MVFIYDSRLALDNNGTYYSRGAFSQKVLDRYLEVFERITIVARRAEGNVDYTKMNPITSDKVAVVFIPDTRSSIKDYLNPVVNKKIKTIIQEQLKEDRAIVVRVPSMNGAIAAKCCENMKKPVLVEVVGCPWDSYWNHSTKGKLMAPYEWYKQRKTVKNADYVLYVTNQFLQRRYPTNGINAGISDVELNPVDKGVLEKRLRKIADHQGIFCIGTAAAVNVPYKGQKYVIEALAELKEKGHTNFEYQLAGGGDATALQELAKALGVEEQIRFLGNIPHKNIFSWLDELDLYIQPSLQEGLPRSVLEAMSRGLPILGSQTGGIPELIGFDYIFSQKDSEEIALMLQKLDVKTMTVMAKGNFEEAKKYSKEIISKSRFDFYKNYANYLEKY